MQTLKMTQAEIEERVRELVLANDNDLVKSAQACRSSNFTAQQCIPYLYKQFPKSTADQLADAAVEVWCASLSTADLIAILRSCKKPDGSRAYSDAEINPAVAANLSLKFLDVEHVPTEYGGSTNLQLKMIGLSQGNLVKLKAAEYASFLVISCLPGDYTPASGTMIKAVKDAYGIHVSTLAADPAADYRSKNHCWISKKLSSYTKTAVPYGRLLCFESTGAAAPGNIPGIFTAIKTFEPNPPAIPNTGATIASAMVSTGDARGDKTAVLTALFNGCWALMNDGSNGGTGYNLTNFRVVVYNTAWEQSMIELFEKLKNQHS